MGLFDKIKGMGQALTGGGAKVSVEVEQAVVGEPFGVRVHVQAEKDIKADAVYLLIRSQEVITIEGTRVSALVRQQVADFDHNARLRDMQDSETTCELRVQVCGPTELAAGQSYDWDAEVKLPGGAGPSFQGQRCSHVWQIQAGIDVFGNDPDSGWVEFQVGQ